MKITCKHILFWGSEFSNFYPCNFKADGIQFHNSEQYFMYRKAMYFGDTSIARRIIKEGSNPKQAKALGRKVKGYNDAEWAKIRYDVMYQAIEYKFNSNKDLKEKLLKYKDKIFVEASPLDRIWGIGLHEDNPDADDESKWLGENLLGKALTQLANSI